MAKCVAQQLQPAALCELHRTLFVTSITKDLPSHRHCFRFAHSSEHIARRRCPSQGSALRVFVGVRVPWHKVPGTQETVRLNGCECQRCAALVRGHASIAESWHRASHMTLHNAHNISRTINPYQTSDSPASPSTPSPSTSTTPPPQTTPPAQSPARSTPPPTSSSPRTSPHRNQA